MLDTLEKQVSDKRAWDHFLKLGLPTKQWEVFRYVRLSDLYSRRYDTAKRVEPSITPKEGKLVFVNGRYAEDLSRPSRGIVALPLCLVDLNLGCNNR